MSSIIFQKTIKKSEKKFKFIQIPAQHMGAIGNPVTVIAKDKTFVLHVNTVGRMISSKLFEHLEPKIDDMLIFEKGSNGNYKITIKESSLRSGFR